MKHKHHNEIIAWANGAEIEFYSRDDDEWDLCVNNHPFWDSHTKYRIKPEPKPDVVKLYYAETDFIYPNPGAANLKLTFNDGKLKAAEVIE